MHKVSGTCSQQVYDSDDSCVARTLGADNFLENDHVGVFESLEEFYFAECGDWKSVFLLFGVDALEGYNFVGGTISRHKDTSVGSFTDLEFLFKGIDIPHDNRCLDRDGVASNHACLFGKRRHTADTA